GKKRPGTNPCITITKAKRTTVNAPQPTRFSSENDFDCVFPAGASNPSLGDTSTGDDPTPPLGAAEGDFKLEA
ncbi:MAG: hypothetical protein ABI871_01785, partial [Chthoniobacterales bacterium]